MDVQDTQDTVVSPAPPAAVAETPPAPAKDDLSAIQKKFAELAAADENPLDVNDNSIAPAPSVPAAVVPPSKPVEPPLAQVHPPSLLEAARNLGIAEHHLKPGVVSSDALLDFVMRERLKDATLAGLQQAAQQIVSPREPVQEEDDDEAVIQQFERDLLLDPKIASIMRKQARQLKELGKRPDPEEVVNKVLSNREAVKAGERIVDNAISKLDPRYEKIVGKGLLRDVTDQRQRAKRMAIYQRAAVNWEKDTVSTIEQKIIDAADHLYGDLLPQKPAAAPATTEPAAPTAPGGGYANGKSPPTKAEWADASLGLPSGSTPSKQDRAQRKVLHDFFRDQGIAFDAREEEFEGVPG